MNQYKSWDSRETNRLKELWSNHSAKEIADKLGRTTGSIYKKIQHIDLTGDGNNKGSGKHWTEEQEQFLEDNWYSMSSYEISDEMDKSPNAIRNKAKRMDLPKKAQNNTFKKWTDDEKMYLVKNHKSKSEKEIANYLGRSISSVNHKKYRMKLNSFWEQWEDEILSDYYYYKRKDAKELSKGLLSHRTISGIKHRTDKLSIDLYPEPRPELTCLNCDETFVVKHYAEKERRFCSKKCSFEYQGPTSIEEKIMDELDESGYDYEFQKEVDNYFADFFIENMDLVIEADGDFWHSGVNQEREGSLLNKGYNVIHFTGTEINNDVKGCLTEALIHFGGVL